MNRYIFLVFILMTSLGASSYSPPENVAIAIAIDLPVMKETKPSGYWYVNFPITKEELRCMALNIYHEARGESIHGQYAVAEVVMNRVTHARYPNTICSVIRDGVYHTWNPAIVVRHKCAWSWWCDGRSDAVTDIHAYRIAYTIAMEVVMDPFYNPTIPYSLYYHADYVSPDWAQEKVRVAVIDTHIFYM